MTTRHTITGTASIIHAVRLPEEEKILNAPGRLLAWLRLANDSRRPATAQDALRNYYMIWEDMHGRPGPGDRGEELKFVRDFASHAKVENPALRAFLRRELGEDAPQFDPSNQKHAAYLERRRDWARSLVEAEIDRHL